MAEMMCAKPSRASVNSRSSWESWASIFYWKAERQISGATQSAVSEVSSHAPIRGSSPQGARPPPNMRRRSGTQNSFTNSFQTAGRGTWSVRAMTSPYGRHRPSIDQEAQDILCEEVLEERIRACSLWDVMKSRGAVLENNAVMTQETHDTLSKPVETIHGFLSHSWRQPRKKKFLEIAFAFHLGPAVTSALIAAAIGSLLHLVKVLPLLEFSYGSQGFAAELLGVAAFFIVFLYWGELQQLRCFRFQGPLVFFDKYCIHQTDLAQKQEGIKALGATIVRSERLIVLYSQSYFRRLWTVFEIAAFMSVHRLGKLTLVPEFLPKVVVRGAFLVAMVHLLYRIFSLQAIMDALGAVATVLQLSTYVILIVPLCVGGCLILRRWARERSKLKQVLSEFEIQKAECHDENDRPVVQGHVARLERAVGLVPRDCSESTALASFNWRVQNQLEPAVQLTFGSQGIPYSVPATVGMALSFDGLDTAVADVIEGEHRKAVLELLGGLDLNLLGIPLLVATMHFIVKRHVGLTGRQETLFLVGSCFAEGLMAILVCGLNFALKRLAVESDEFLIMWVAWIAFECLLTWLAFKPPHIERAAGDVQQSQTGSAVPSPRASPRGGKEAATGVAAVAAEDSQEPDVVSDEETVAI